MSQHHPKNKYKIREIICVRDTSAKKTGRSLSLSLREQNKKFCHYKSVFRNKLDKVNQISPTLQWINNYLPLILLQFELSIIASYYLPDIFTNLNLLCMTHQCELCGFLLYYFKHSINVN
jgi:hypothetical protein